MTDVMWHLHDSVAGETHPAWSSWPFQGKAAPVGSFMTAPRALALTTSPSSIRTSAGIPCTLKRDAIAACAALAEKGTASQGMLLK